VIYAQYIHFFPTTMLIQGTSATWLKLEEAD